MSNRWNVQDIPDQSAKVIVITGANSGLGYAVAQALAGKNANLVLAVRSLDKGEKAAAEIKQQHPSAQLRVMALDLADLESIRAFALAFLAQYSRLDVLINNAGVMALPNRRTAQGFEMQFGTNHLGHFALTGQLLPALKATPAARVVTQSSLMHRFGAIHFDDLQWTRRYERWGAYGQSKLANLLFAYELQRRLQAANIAAISVACHPGYSSTNLQTAGVKMDGSSWMARLIGLGNIVLAQSAEMGALPALFAATAPEVQGEDFIGPTGMGGTRGYPEKVRSTPPSYDQVAARRLWAISEELTGVKYAFAS
jgi:NAD(P)-dependent dehydrogenase (short-subunit alcohol dehydrogenase family)